MDEAAKVGPRAADRDRMHLRVVARNGMENGDEARVAVARDRLREAVRALLKAIDDLP
jgi:hypothetical protein